MPSPEFIIYTTNDYSTPSSNVVARFLKNSTSDKYAADRLNALWVEWGQGMWPHQVSH
jgi:hypothetical protein